MHHSRILSNSKGWVAAAVLILLSSVALARHHPRAVAGGGVPGQFDYYLLTLSWAPSYCLVHPGDRYECQGRGFGFVLHGLWPQFDAGGWPQDCQTDATLDGAAQAIGRTVYPSPRLMEHEWQRHGTCSGLGAADYFRTADRAMAVLHLPAPFDAPRADQQLTPEQILGAFHRSNPALPEQSLRVACTRGELSEIRLCLNRNLQPQACGRGVRDGCPQTSVLVRSAR